MYILDNGTNKDIDHYIEDKVNSLIGGGQIVLNSTLQMIS